jgi:hypothetical protein
MGKLLLLFIAATPILVVLAQIDDELSEESKRLLSRAEAPEHSEAYVFLMGISAGEGESPTRVGERILEEIERLKSDSSYELPEHEASKKLSLPNGRAFCSAWEKTCFELLFSSQFDIEKLRDENAILVSRSGRFLEFQEYRSLTKPGLQEYIPPFRYIAAAERIKVLNAISLYKNGSPGQAVDALLGQFSQIRSSMELQDSLIGKMVLLIKLSEILDVVSVILSEEGRRVKAIPPLTQSEKGFGLAAAREFAAFSNELKRLDKHPDFFGGETSFASVEF